MKNTYKKGTAFFVLGVLVSQGISSVLSDVNYSAPAYAETSVEVQKIRGNIISDEVSLDNLPDLTSAPNVENIISDEVSLEKVEIVQTEGIFDKDSASEMVLTVARGLSNKEYIYMYIEAKNNLQEEAGFRDLEAAWIALSEAATQKKDSELMDLKINFVSIYLALTDGVVDVSLDNFEYEGVSKEVFEKNIMSYLDSQNANDYQYSNAMKLIAMVEIYNAATEAQKVDMQKSLVTQFGRVLE